MQAIGVDLSKNHFGFCHIDKEGKTTLRYVYFKEYLQKERKENLKNPRQYFKTIEREVKENEFTFEKIKFSYDNKNYNQIQSDALKSKLNLNLLEEYLLSIDGPKFVVLEDYVMQGGKIVQLVHVGESFKYQFTDKEKWKSVILFLCPVQTWRSSMCGHIHSAPGCKQTPYEKIDIALRDNDKTYQFIKTLNETDDVVKDLIDCYGLARMHKHYNEIFLAQYSNRIFIF